VIRVLLADDHTLIRDGLRALLATAGDIEVVAEAADGREAVERARTTAPDVILLDIAMPGLGGLEAVPLLKREVPDARILILTQYEQADYVRRFLRLGVAGYVLKKAAGTELISAIRPRIAAVSSWIRRSPGRPRSSRARVHRRRRPIPTIH
jgi:two-component system response regulator NreC